MKIWLGDKELEVKASLYSDLFQTSKGYVTFVKGDHYFVWSNNSDGSEAYQLVWIVSKGGVVKRWVGGY